MDAEWICLQREFRPGETAALTAKPKIRIFGEEIGDFADTAALIDHMDLVVTVDTSVAHLAGALGKPVWVLLRHSPDWRWLLDRGDTPWYPSARLFRQPTVGDWRSVVNEVTAQIVRRYA